MNATHRTQVYYQDMGMFRKHYIQEMTFDEICDMNASENFMAVVLPDSDPFGHECPETF